MGSNSDNKPYPRWCESLGHLHSIVVLQPEGYRGQMRESQPQWMGEGGCPVSMQTVPECSVKPGWEAREKPRSVQLPPTHVREGGAGNSETGLRRASLRVLGFRDSQEAMSFSSLFFRPCSSSPVILVPCPGIEATPLALGVQSLNHWTTREVPRHPFMCKGGIDFPQQCIQPFFKKPDGSNNWKQTWPHQMPWSLLLALLPSRENASFLKYAWSTREAGNRLLQAQRQDATCSSLFLSGIVFFHFHSDTWGKKHGAGGGKLGISVVSAPVPGVKYTCSFTGDEVTHPIRDLPRWQFNFTNVMVIWAFMLSPHRT